MTHRLRPFQKIYRPDMDAIDLHSSIPSNIGIKRGNLSNEGVTRRVQKKMRQKRVSPDEAGYTLKQLDDPQYNEYLEVGEPPGETRRAPKGTTVRSVVMKNWEPVLDKKGNKQYVDVNIEGDPIIDYKIDHKIGHKSFNTGFELGLTPRELRKRVHNKRSKKMPVGSKKAINLHDEEIMALELAAKRGDDVMSGLSSEVTKRLMADSSIRGERITKRGEVVIADRAMHALKRIFVESSAIFTFPPPPREWKINPDLLPIKESDDDLIITTIPEESIVYRKLDHDDKSQGDFKAYYTFVENSCDLKPEIITASKAREEDRPLIFAVTSSKHATICIILDNILYSIGYGYEDEIAQKPSAHFTEILTGSLYSRDDILPSANHESSIAWIGFLGPEICNRMRTFVRSATGIVYKGRYAVENKKRFSYNITSVYHLILPPAITYSESAGSTFINSLSSILNRSSVKTFTQQTIKDAKSLNCIEWLKLIIGENLNCNPISTFWLSHPRHCKGVTNTEWDQFVTALQSGNKSTIMGVVKGIQTRLLKYFGGKKHKTYKNKNKRMKTRKNKV